MAQASSLRSVARWVDAYGDRPDLRPSSAFQEILKTRDLYSGGVKNLATYFEGGLRLFEGRTRPRDLLPCLPPGARKLLENSRFTICRSAQELDSTRESGELPAITPYWDPVLRSS